MAKVYAVKVGKVTGIFPTWEECQKQVAGFKGAQFKAFKTEEEAVAYLSGRSVVKATGTVAYVDGSYRLGVYAWALVIVNTATGEIVHQDAGTGNDPQVATLNNIAGELGGAMRAAMWAANNNTPITIVHDYDGVGSWAKHEWKASNPFVKKYIEFMTSEKVKPFILDYEKVNGHSAVDGNVIADKLAKQALNSHK